MDHAIGNTHDEEESDHERFVHLPLNDLDELPDNITDFDDDEEVTVTIKGTMKSLTQRSGHLEPWENKGDLELQVETIKIEGKNVFDELADV